MSVSLLMHAIVMKGKEKLEGREGINDKISVTENHVGQTVGISVLCLTS